MVTMTTGANVIILPQACVESSPGVLDTSSPFSGTYLGPIAQWGMMVDPSLVIVDSLGTIDIDKAGQGGPVNGSWGLMTAVHTNGLGWYQIMTNTTSWDNTYTFLGQIGEGGSSNQYWYTNYGRVSALVFEYRAGILNVSTAALCRKPVRDASGPTNFSAGSAPTNEKLLNWRSGGDYPVTLAGTNTEVTMIRVTINRNATPYMPLGSGDPENIAGPRSLTGMTTIIFEDNTEWDYITDGTATNIVWTFDSANSDALTLTNGYFGSGTLAATAGAAIFVDAPFAAESAVLATS